MSKEKLVPTEKEVKAALALQEHCNPDYDYKKAQREAKKEGYKDEKCPKCGQVYLACIHFVACQEDDCPMKSEDKRSLLDMMLDANKEEKAK